MFESAHRDPCRLKQGRMATNLEIKRANEMAGLLSRNASPPEYYGSSSRTAPQLVCAPLPAMIRRCAFAQYHFPHILRSLGKGLSGSMIYVEHTPSNLESCYPCLATRQLRIESWKGTHHAPCSMQVSTILLMLSGELGNRLWEVFK